MNEVNVRNTKIVCTLGPASESVETIKEMLAAGMDCARFNFSHGDHAEQKMRIDAAKNASEETGRNIAFMLDTKGPEIRIKQFENKTVMIHDEQHFTLCCYDCVGDETKVAVTYDKLYEQLKPGDIILIDDGLISFSVEEISDKDIIMKANNSGKLSNNKSINIPGVHIMLPALTERDISDIIFGIENDFDYIAASFIRSAEDIKKIKQVLRDNNGSDIKVIAKIENREGVDNLEEILAECDGIMVGRGDLGVEIPAEEVPSVQKQIIRSCNAAGKPVITATQMLESMTVNSRPTRAEVGDVANAMYDGSDAVMLSGESAAGAYPVESVETMARILLTAERTISQNANYKKGFKGNVSITDTIAYCACSSAENLCANAIVTPTTSGNTARAVAKFRPEMIQLAVTNNKKVRRQLCLVWGVIPLYIDKWESLALSVKHCLDYALNNSLLKDDDLVAVTAGMPLGKRGTTNTLQIDYVKDYYER